MELLVRNTPAAQASIKSESVAGITGAGYATGIWSFFM